MAAKSIEALTLRDDELDVEMRVLARTDAPGVVLELRIRDEHAALELDADTGNELRLAVQHALEKSKPAESKGAKK
ncbi:MAG TPA: hypothetical protein VFT98_03620 [Myxococcota bacterium]|nr:hypothetical protein [Myxococcota bacterium]